MRWWYQIGSGPRRGKENCYFPMIVEANNLQEAKGIADKLAMSLKGGQFVAPFNWLHGGQEGFDSYKEALAHATKRIEDLVKGKAKKVPVVVSENSLLT